MSEPGQAILKMQNWRKKMNHSTKSMAKILEISESLLDTIEAGRFTHPKIAKRIQTLVGLTDEETAQLVSPVKISPDPWCEGRKKQWSDQDKEFYHYKDQRFKKKRCKA